MGYLRAASYNLLGDTLYAIARYRRTFGVWPNLLHPETFNEHINRKKLFGRTRLLTALADKFAVRNYVEDRIGRDYLTKLYQVTTTPEEIDLANLPRNFVVKATHGSGWNYIVPDKETLAIDRLFRCCRTWLNDNYYYHGREWVYRDIPPRLIVEEFLEDHNGEVPHDYKFFCFGGKPIYIQADVGRFTDHRQNLYDTNWRLIPVTLMYPRSSYEIAVPPALEEMLRVAQSLADGLDFVRVDLYCVQDRIVFGEMTHYPHNGFSRFDPPEFDRVLGEEWP